MNRAARWALLVLGTFALGLGLAGLFLPLVPTTPFLLLAAACYARSSPRFYDWLINHRQLGEYIRNYRDKRAIKQRARVTAIVLLWLTIGASVLFVDDLWLRLTLAVVAIGVTIHLLSLRTIRF